jgi:hypothetical protein
MKTPYTLRPNVLAVDAEILLATHEPILSDQSMLVTTPGCQKEQIWGSEKPIIWVLVQGNNISNRMVLQSNSATKKNLKPAKVQRCKK